MIWNPEKKSDDFKIPTSGKIIKTVRFKPDENTLAVGYTDGYIELWDITTQKRILEINAHTADINDIKFNKKFSQMATASKDGTLKLWDTGDLTAPPINFNDNEGFVMVIEFSPDGQMIVSGTYEGNNNLIGRPTQTDILAQNICPMLTRNFSTDEWKTYIGSGIEYEKTCPEKELNIKVNVIR
jgi:WD40 repeat protein